MNIIELQNIFRLIAVKRNTIAIIIFIFVLVSLIYSLLLPNRYISKASLLPSGSGGGPFGLISGLMPGLLDQMSSNEGLSSFLFMDILKSKTVLTSVVNEPFDSIGKSISGSTNLKSYLNIKKDDFIEPVFLKDSQFNYSLEKGILTISYESKYPYISYYVMSIWLKKLEWFLQNNMQTQAKTQYDYLVIRKDEAYKAVIGAEDSLKIFINTHRNYSQDPIINMEYERLDIILSSRVEVYKYIVQQMETARIDMIKSTPAMSVLDMPQIPQKKSSPKRARIVIVGFFMGIIFSIIFLGFDNRKYIYNKLVNQK
jgi:hypothetical protein